MTGKEKSVDDNMNQYSTYKELFTASLEYLRTQRDDNQDTKH